MTLKVSEYPALPLSRAEQASLFFNATSEVGSLATARYVDLYVDMSLRDGYMNPDTRNQFIVHGMGGVINRSVVLDQGPEPAGTKCMERTRSRNTTAPKPLDSWLTRHEGQLHRLSCRADEEGILQRVSLEPTSPVIAKDMLAAVHADSRPLPEWLALLALSEGRGDTNRMLVPAGALVPAVAELTTSVGRTLLGGLRERQRALATMRYNVGSSGRVYGDILVRDKPHTIELDVSDGVARKRAKFALSFKHGQVHDGLESAFMSCKLQTSGPELPTVTERLAIQDNEMTIVPDSDPGAAYTPAGNGLSDLLDKALQVLKRA